MGQGLSKNRTHVGVVTVLLVLSATDGQSTALLSKSDVRARTRFFVGEIAIGGILLIVAALIAAWKKKRRGASLLSAGPYRIVKGKGITVKGPDGERVLCCAADVQKDDYSPLVDDDAEAKKKQGDASADEAGTKDSTDNGPVFDDAALTRLLNAEKKGESKHSHWVFARKMLLGGLFLLYVLTSMLLPAMKAHTATCQRGFFWEDHMWFVALTYGVKIVELTLYVFDPTVKGTLDWLDVMVLFVPSFLGFIDGYTDATAFVIAYQCGTSLSMKLAYVMLAVYLLGVVIGQWLVIAAIGFRAESPAIVMKVLHMDALASCITLPESEKRIWVAVNVVRTFGEDIPQAFLQTLYVLKVKKNPFMIVSVCISVVCSLKAVIDSCNRGLMGKGGLELLLEMDNTEELEIDLDGALAKQPSDSEVLRLVVNCNNSELDLQCIPDRFPQLESLTMQKLGENQVKASAQYWNPLRQLLELQTMHIKNTHGGDNHINVSLLESMIEWPDGMSLTSFTFEGAMRMDLDLYLRFVKDNKVLSTNLEKFVLFYHFANPAHVNNAIFLELTKRYRRLHHLHVGSCCHSLTDGAFKYFSENDEDIHSGSELTFLGLTCTTRVTGEPWLQKESADKYLPQLAKFYLSGGRQFYDPADHPGEEKPCGTSAHLIQALKESRKLEFEHDAPFW